MIWRTTHSATFQTIQSRRRVSLVVRRMDGRTPHWFWQATVAFATSREVGQLRGTERTKKAAQAAATAAGHELLKPTT